MHAHTSKIQSEKVLWISGIQWYNLQRDVRKFIEQPLQEVNNIDEKL